MNRLLTVLWCGWILWASVYKTDGAGHFSDFSSPLAVDGYPTYEGCLAAYAKGAKEQDARLSAPGARVISHYETTWRCFPSDFDPREKK